MTPFHKGFADELSKVAGAFKSIGKFVVKHPLATAAAVGTAGMTGYSAVSAYKQGLRGGEKPRYLYASPDAPSQAAYMNYHEIIGNKKPSPKQVKALSKHYDEKKFNR